MIPRISRHNSAVDLVLLYTETESQKRKTKHKYVSLSAVGKKYRRKRNFCHTLLKMLDFQLRKRER
jgi:hypothetical protein